MLVPGLGNEAILERALCEIHGKVSVMSDPTSIPLKRLAELGVSRVSFGPRILGLTRAHFQATTTVLPALGDYPSELRLGY